jgi:hypothetical protein
MKDLRFMSGTAIGNDIPRVFPQTSINRKVPGDKESISLFSNFPYPGSSIAGKTVREVTLFSCSFIMRTRIHQRGAACS